MPPPSTPALFPLTMLLISVNVPASLKMPPPSSPASFPVTVLLVSVNMPTLKMPPPRPPVPPLRIVTPLMLTVIPEPIANTLPLGRTLLLPSMTVVECATTCNGETASDTQFAENVQKIRVWRQNDLDRHPARALASSMAARSVQMPFPGAVSQTPLPGLASGRSTLVFTVNTAACAYAAVTNQKKTPRHLRVQGLRSLPIDVLLVCLFC